MPRRKGSGRMGPVRALRLPKALELWLQARLRERQEVSCSALLLELIHGGLRLVPGYMVRHGQRLRLSEETDPSGRRAYLDALRDTFGEHYMAHLQQWLEAETPSCKQ